MTRLTNDDILAAIKAKYAPYDTLPAFSEGMKAYFLDGPHRLSPYERAGSLGQSVASQAWDRGASAAMLYQRAISYRDSHEAEVLADTAGAWLDRLCQHGGRA